MKFHFSVEVKLELWGFQTKIEEFIHKVILPSLIQFEIDLQVRQ